MNKAIVVLTGVPQGKTRFSEIVKETCWSWSANPKNLLTKWMSEKNFYWDGQKTEEFYKFLNNLLSLLNEAFSFEEKYVKETIDKFLADQDVVKTWNSNSGQGREFENFLLVFHGLSKNLTENLKDEFGVFQIHISERSLNTNIASHDYVLYYDDESFEADVKRLLNILMNNKKENN